MWALVGRFVVYAICQHDWSLNGRSVSASWGSAVKYSHVVTVQVVRQYVLDVTFSDGTEREIDVESQLYGQMFEPLRDHELFCQVKVDPELGTVVWPNGADLSPEFLYGGGVQDATSSDGVTTEAEAVGDAQAQK
jgi:hypothetical protein